MIAVKKRVVALEIVLGGRKEGVVNLGKSVVALETGLGGTR